MLLERFAFNLNCVWFSNGFDDELFVTLMCMLQTEFSVAQNLTFILTVGQEEYVYSQGCHNK
jgi:hypothetical protein